MGWPVHSYGTEQFGKWFLYGQERKREQEKEEAQNQAKIEERLREIKKDQFDREIKIWERVNQGIDTYNKLVDSGNYSPSELRKFKEIMQNQFKTFGKDIDFVSATDLSQTMQKYTRENLENKLKYFEENPYSEEAKYGLMRTINWFKASKNKENKLHGEFIESEFKRIQKQKEQEAKIETEELTIYGPGSATKRITRPKGTPYIPQSGWSLRPPQQATPKQPLTLNDINKRLQNLQTVKLRVQTTKGIDPMLVGLFGDSPGLQEALKSGNTEEAITELDKQIAYYSDLRAEKTGSPKPSLPKGLPNAKANKGRTVRDTETGKRYKSNGVTWVEVQ